MGIDYTGLSITYDDYRSFSEELLKRIVELGRLRTGARVLDIGCGTGAAAARMREATGAAVFGLDKSLGMLLKARGRGVPVLCADADGRALPLRDSSFDLVIAIYVIHHMRHLKLLFGECRRVLVKGPLLLLTASHDQIEHQHPTVKRFFPSFVSIDVGRFPDLPVVDGALREAGFDRIEHVEIRRDRIPLDKAHLEKVKNKYISTYELIPEEEFRSGVRKLEAYIRGLRAPEFRQWRATLIVADKRGE
jgi:SAM-dependent methyltransferase